MLSASEIRMQARESLKKQMESSCSSYINLYSYKHWN